MCLRHASCWVPALRSLRSLGRDDRSKKLILAPPASPILLAPLSTWDAAAERLCGAGAVTRLRQASVPSWASDARFSSPQIPGPRIEAVQRWQHSARTPVAQRRSPKRCAAARGPGRERLSRSEREPDRRPADDVIAPSARQATGAGAEELPFVATGSQCFSARAPFLPQTLGSVCPARPLRLAPHHLSQGERSRAWRSWRSHASHGQPSERVRGYDLDDGYAPHPEAHCIRFRPLPMGEVKWSPTRYPRVPRACDHRRANDETARYGESTQRHPDQ